MRTTRRLLTAGVLAAVGLWAVGCQGDGSTSPPPSGGGGVVIGPAGGTVTSTDGNFTITIPAGALDAATEVTVTKVDVVAAIRLAASKAPSPVAMKAGPSAPLATEMVYVTGTGYEVKPSGIQLHTPANLKIKYDPNNVPGDCDPQLLRIRYRERAQLQWMDGVHVAVRDNAVEGNASVFTTFAIFGPAQPVASVVNVSPATLDVEEGDVVQLSAEVLDADGAVLDVPVTWSVDDPAVATVDVSGLLTALVDGTTSVTATAGGKQGSAGLKVNKKVASVDITAVPEEVIEGETATLVADVRDAGGTAISNPTVSWTSLTPAIATVDATGTVTGVSAGDATIVASSRTKSDTVTVTISANVASIVISGGSSSPLQVGGTRQLTATAYNSSGQPVTAKFKWASSSVAIATVDGTGLVTGVGPGTASITASSARATASVDVKVVGDTGEETTGNNLSWPVVFADGTGLTGLPVATDPGVRPLTTETAASAELLAIAPTNPSAAFFFSGNVVDATTGYYLQGTASTWRAQVVDGTGQSPYDASIYWGDNIAGGTGNLSAGHPIRVEVALSTTDGVTLSGYNMPYVANPSSPEEVQGTDGTTLAQVPLIYSGGATLIIEQLSGPGGSVVAEISSAEYKAEINVGGRIIYGAQFKPTVAGTYRLRFVLASQANVKITAIGNAAGSITIVSPKESAIEIQVTA